MNLALAAPFGMVDLRNDPRIMPISGTRNVNQVTRSARHHSGTATGDVFAFQNHWRNVLRWITGGYHFVILRNGFIQWVYDFHVISNGVGGHNTDTVHVCLVGSGSFTPEQERAYEWLMNSHIRPRIPAITVPRVLGHREFSGHASNQCPGINMTNVRARLSGPVAPQPPTSPVDATTHTVVRGETLSGIALRFNTTVAELQRLNNIPNPNLIRVGQVLTIRQNATTHTVRAGETLSGIAQQHRTTVAELTRLNNLSNPNLIRVGQVLRLR